MAQIDAMSMFSVCVYGAGHLITIINLSCGLHENKNQMTHE